MAGPLNMSNNKITHLAKPTDDKDGVNNTGNAFFGQITNPYVYHQFNMVKNKIINLGDPTDDTDAVNKQYLEKSHVKPSHYNNEFKYLMTNKLAWTDLEPNNIDSFIILCVLKSSIQITNYGITQLLQLIKPHQRGYQLLVLRYKSFLTGTQIVVGTLHICIISK